MLLLSKPPFRFVGNKSNRRRKILETLHWHTHKVNCVYDLFGGSLYCSHLLSYIREECGYKFKIITNDFDDYSSLFNEEFLTALTILKSITDRSKVPRDAVMEPEICAEIDAHLDLYDNYRHYLVNYLSIYGNTLKFRNRVSSHNKPIKLSSYVKSDLILSEDYRTVIDIMYASRLGKGLIEDSHVWICDPPYHSSSAKVNYKGTEDVDPKLYTKLILEKFPNDVIINFSYTKDLQFDDYSVILDSVYTRIAGGIAKEDRCEYTHIVRKGLR